jgi:hypothetical protein
VGLSVRWDEIGNAVLGGADAVVIGDRWTLLVLRDALPPRWGLFRQLGVTRPARGSPTQLVAAGILEKVRYQEKDALQYRLTEKGLELTRSSCRCSAGATAGWPTNTARR